ncbi:MAG: DNA-binding protein [Magnetococcales bacterium]|nr:DNA-binding protein [Magnetococcales bacterium]
MKQIIPGACWMGRLPHGSDLLESLNQICREQGIRLGRIEGLGAVKRARLGFYDQERKSYDFLEFDQPLEITQLTGNVSLKEGQPFVHVHVTLADHAGHAFGGHLASGTEIFAAEVIIQAFDGEPLQRGWDDVTGLPLWSPSGT